MDKNLFTLSSDSNDRFINLLCFLESNKHYNDFKTFIIPFDDNLEITSYISRLYTNVKIINPDESFDIIGKSIFHDREYRDGVPCWRLFRKLNFIPKNDFESINIFMDNNSVIVNNIEDCFLNLYNNSNVDVVFGARSLKDRTLSYLGFNIAEKLNETVKDGFNAGLMITNRSIFSNICLKSNLDFGLYSDLISIAPEQGFLALYLATNNYRCRCVSEISKNIKPMISGTRENLEEFEIGKVNLIKNKTPLIIKWSGHINLENKECVPNQDFLVEILCSSLNRMKSSDFFEKSKHELIVRSINKFFKKIIFEE